MQIFLLYLSQTYMHGRLAYHTNIHTHTYLMPMPMHIINTYVILHTLPFTTLVLHSFKLIFLTTPVFSVCTNDWTLYVLFRYSWLLVFMYSLQYSHLTRAKMHPSPCTYPSTHEQLRSRQESTLHN